MMLTVAYNKHQIYGILKDYHWMVREIGRIDRQLSSTDFAGVAQYGIEATMPKSQGVVGRALENEIIRREAKSKNIYEYASKVNFINENLHKVTDERQKVILDCLLDGISLTGISHHLKMGRKQVNEARDKIVDTLCK